MERRCKRQQTGGRTVVKVRHRDTGVVWDIPEPDAQALLEQEMWEQVETEEEK